MIAANVVSFRGEEVLLLGELPFDARHANASGEESPGQPCKIGIGPSTPSLWMPEVLRQGHFGAREFLVNTGPPTLQCFSTVDRN